MNESRSPGAYVHVPFCAHRCTYCSFVALEGKREEEDFFEGLKNEIRSRKGGIPAGFGAFDTVYFGGGTPSYVDARRLGSVLFTLSPKFHMLLLKSPVEVLVKTAVTGAMPLVGDDANAACTGAYTVIAFVTVFVSMPPDPLIVNVTV